MNETTPEVAAVRLGDLPAFPVHMPNGIPWQGLSTRLYIALEMYKADVDCCEMDEAFKLADDFLLHAAKHDLSIDRTKVYSKEAKEENAK